MKDGGPAFPQNRDNYSGADVGISMRDYFASAALQGISARGWVHFADGDRIGMKEEIVELCYQVADAMLAEREKSK